MVAFGDSVYHGLAAGRHLRRVPRHRCEGNTAGTGPDGQQVAWGDGSYASIVKTIREGVATPKEHTGVMPPMGGAQLTPAQLAAVGAYVFSLSHPGG